MNEQHPDILDAVYRVIRDRKNNPSQQSYTASLYAKGLDKILGKVGEEATELAVAGKGGDPDQVVPVSMRDEDRHTAGTQLREPKTKLGRTAARIDDDGLSVDARSHDVAVRPDRSERKLFDAQRHVRARQLPRLPPACSRRARRRLCDR